MNVYHTCIYAHEHACMHNINMHIHVHHSMHIYYGYIRLSLVALLSDVIEILATFLHWNASLSDDSEYLKSKASLRDENTWVFKKRKVSREIVCYVPIAYPLPNIYLSATHPLPACCESYLPIVERGGISTPAVSIYCLLRKLRYLASTRLLPIRYLLAVKATHLLWNVEDCLPAPYPSYYLLRKLCYSSFSHMDIRYVFQP
jgi:hypothetical protein